jgi:hypothetical protein
VFSCLCSTFGVQHVQQLGHGSVQRLLHLCSSTVAAVADSAVGKSSCVWGVYALAAPALAGQAAAAAAGIAPKAMHTAGAELAQEETAAPSTGGHGVLGCMGRQDALRCLAAAPCMADLHSWASWQQVRGDNRLSVFWPLLSTAVLLCCWSSWQQVSSTARVSSVLLCVGCFRLGLYCTWLTCTAGPAGSRWAALRLLVVNCLLAGWSLAWLVLCTWLACTAGQAGSRWAVPTASITLTSANAAGVAYALSAVLPLMVEIARCPATWFCVVSPCCC